MSDETLTVSVSRASSGKTKDAVCTFESLAELKAFIKSTENDIVLGQGLNGQWFITIYDDYLE